MKQHKQIEIYEFIHKGITILVKIDYLNNEISFLSTKHLSIDINDPKHFVFAKRGVEYMNGWLTILEALQEATKDAKKKYEANLAEESSFKSEKIIEKFGFKKTKGK